MQIWGLQSGAYLDKEESDSVGLERTTKVTIFDSRFDIGESIQRSVLLEDLLLHIFHLQKLLW